MTTASKARFEKKRLNTLYRQHRVALPGNLAVALFVVALFYRKVPARDLFIWFLAMAGVLLIRFLIFHNYNQQAEDAIVPGKMFVKCALSTFANGILWGVFGVYTYYHVPLIYFFFALIILGGMVAAAAATNSVSIPIFFAFTLPIILPVCLVLLMTGQFERILLGLLTLAYLGVMSQSARQLNKVILTSIRYRYENLQLLNHLKKEEIQTRKLNARLALDIEKRKKAEEEKERLIRRLQKALDEVKTLSGMIPICANCKKVRDDKGYWDQIETYIHKHSNADFSHGICPECAKELYPDIDLEND